MPTDAQKKANAKYQAKQDRIVLRPSKEEGAFIRENAEQAGQSAQAYILQATRERIERENKSQQL